MNVLNNVRYCRYQHLCLQYFWGPCVSSKLLSVMNLLIIPELTLNTLPLVSCLPDIPGAYTYPLVVLWKLQQLTQLPHTTLRGRGQYCQQCCHLTFSFFTCEASSSLLFCSFQELPNKQTNCCIQELKLSHRCMMNEKIVFTRQCVSALSGRRYTTRFE